MMHRQLYSFNLRDRYLCFFTLYRFFPHLCKNCEDRTNSRIFPSFASGKERNGGDKNSRWKKPRFAYAAASLAVAMSPFVSIKHLLGLEKAHDGDDPIRDKVVKAIALRAQRRYDEALAMLEVALKEAHDAGIEMHVTRICDELANVYYEQGDLDSAEAIFRRTIQRLIHLHQKNESSPEFIGISLKIADIFAQRGQLENAEIGYKHCVSKQMQVVEERMRMFYISKGSYSEADSPPDEFGIEYTDPYALFGMALEQYAHFLVRYCGPERMLEAQEFMDEVLKISFHIYGVNNFHSVNLLNNFAAYCITKNYFEVARNNLEKVLHRVPQISECSSILVSFYCNYAETLFHTGELDAAVAFAAHALRLSAGQDEAIQRYAHDFNRQIERDARRAARRTPKTQTKTPEKVAVIAQSTAADANEPKQSADAKVGNSESVNGNTVASEVLKSGFANIRKWVAL